MFYDRIMQLSKYQKRRVLLASLVAAIITCVYLSSSGDIKVTKNIAARPRVHQRSSVAARPRVHQRSSYGNSGRREYAETRTGNSDTLLQDVQLRTGDGTNYNVTIAGDKKLNAISWTTRETTTTIMPTTTTTTVSTTTTRPSTTMRAKSITTTTPFVPQTPPGYDPMAYPQVFYPNVSCSPEPQLCDINKPVVPNLVHFLWFYKNVTEFPFYFLVTGMSVLKFQVPEEIWFWYSDSPPVGKYWKEFIQKVEETQYTQLKLKPTDAPSKIFGRTVKFPEHKSDIKRIEILSHYGGIYLDSDMFILRSLKPLMCYEHTQGRETGGAIANGFMMSAPAAEYLQIWYNAYRTSYENGSWSADSVIKPINLWKKYPDKIHVENQCLIRPNWGELDTLLYQKGYFDFSRHYGIHLYIRFYALKVTPESIKTAPDGMSQIAYYIYYGEKRKDTIGL